MRHLTKRLLTAIGAMVASAMLLPAAHASPSSSTEEFQCDAIGDGAFVVYISADDVRTAWAHYLLDGEYDGDPHQSSTKLNLRSGEQYVGDGLVFSIVGNDGQITDRGVDMTVPRTRVSGGTQDHGSGAVGGNETWLNQPGKSLGGNMRNGPGTNFSKVRSVAEGTPLTLVANTGVRFDGYDWFEVRLNGGKSGYIWGGILCSNGERLSGILYACEEWTAVNQHYNKQNNGGWMAFAIGPNGRWGHGAASSQFQARQFALNNCGANCRIDAETQSNCQALATAPGQFWYGDAGSAQRAEQNALNFCTAKSSGCRVEYSYCR